MSDRDRTDINDALDGLVKLGAKLSRNPVANSDDALAANYFLTLTRIALLDLNRIADAADALANAQKSRFR